MRCKCAMYGCKAATYNKIGYLLNFHRFPKDPVRQQIWKDLCKNPRIMNKNHSNIWLCSLHFESSCYVKEYLKPDAVPTLRLPGRPSVEQAANETDSNSSLLEADVNDDRRPKQLETVKRKIEEHSPEELFEIKGDDCESVTFSSSELEGSGDNEDSDRDSPQPSCSNVVKEDNLPLIVQSQNTSATRVPPPNSVEPVRQILPKISNVSSVAETARPSTSRAPISAVINKVVQDNFEETEQDDCSIFASHVKMRMRRFDNAQKVIAQKLISDILFMADTMQLNLASAVVNPQAQAAQFAQAVHDAQVAHAARLAHAAQLAQTVKSAQVPQEVNNGLANKAVGGSLPAYVIDSDDDVPLAKKSK